MTAVKAAGPDPSSGGSPCAAKSGASSASSASGSFAAKAANAFRTISSLPSCVRSSDLSWLPPYRLAVSDGGSGGGRARRGRPLFGPRPVGDRVRGGAGAGGQPELREHPSHVVLDGPGADEQPLADLGVGQAVADQREHLGLAAGQR